MKHFEDIKDDEIRIISRQEVKRKPLYRRWWFWAAIAAALVSLAVILALSMPAVMVSWCVVRKP